MKKIGSILLCLVLIFANLPIASAELGGNQPVPVLIPTLSVEPLLNATFPEGQANAVTLRVLTTHVANGKDVTVSVLNQVSKEAASEVAVLVADVTNNQATVNLVLPSTLKAGQYILKVAVEGTTLIDETVVVTLTAKAADLSTVQVAESSQIPVESISATPSTLNLVKSTGESVAVAFTPSNATNQELTWSSNNAAVAEYNLATGKIEAKSAGTAIVKAKSVSGNKETSINVTVINALVPVTAIKTTPNLAGAPVVLNKGQKTYLTTAVEPSNASDKTVSWLSENPNVAKVDASIGEIEGVSSGDTAIVLKNGSVTLRIPVHVNVSVTGITVSPAASNLGRGQTLQLSANLTPNAAENKEVSWVSSNSSVATVSPSGVVTGVSTGTASIAAISVDSNLRASASIQVTVQVTEVVPSVNTMSLSVGEKKSISATVSPSDASDKSLTWTSTNPDVATVSSGEVTALKGGKTDIVVQSGSASARIEVTVLSPLKGIQMNTSTLKATVGEQPQLSVVFNPLDATNKTIVWSSSNTQVATVINGKVTAKAVGTCTIKALSLEGEYVATCEVSVSAAASNNSQASSGGGGSSSGSSSGSTGTSSNTTNAGVSPKQTMTVPSLQNTAVEMKLDTKTKNAAVQIDRKMIESLSPLEKVIALKVPFVAEAKSYQVSLPSQLLVNGTLSKEVVLTTEVAEIKMPPNMFSGLKLKAEDTVQIKMNSVDKGELPTQVRAMVGDRPVVDLSALVNNAKVAWNDPNAPVTVTIPYQPTLEELKNPEFINIWFIQADGSVEKIPSATYSQNTGMVAFKTTHFSHYSVVYEMKTFKDMSTYSWAQKQVNLLASKGVIQFANGVDFLPAKAVTRGEFIDQLVRSLGLRAAGSAEFSDVKKTDYYYDSIATAKALGITSGVTKTEFKPNSSITRQDMMTLMVKAMKVSGYKELNGQKSKLTAFKDAGKVANYAAESVSALIALGMVKGDGTSLNPTGNTSRAEAAALVFKLYRQ